MNQFKIITHVFFAITCTLAIQSKSFAEPTCLSQLKTEIKAYHDSGEYNKELTQAIATATHYIVQRAETNEKSTHPQKLAIVLDIDETCLSNYSYLIARDFADDKQKMHSAWREAKAPAIKPMLSLYRKALENHVSVFFVTAREKSFQKPTYENLKSAGYQQWTGIYFKPEHYDLPSKIPFKTEAREKITQKGYTVIASIGDQMSDLVGGYTEKTFKLPNPWYFAP
jgi:predicted secreted acid phosphatase